MVVNATFFNEEVRIEVRQQYRDGHFEGKWDDHEVIMSKGTYDEHRGTSVQYTAELYVGRRLYASGMDKAGYEEATKNMFIDLESKIKERQNRLKVFEKCL